MLTTMDEDVLELWTMTVTSTPITSPATGFANTTLSWKISPAAFPIYNKTQHNPKNVTYAQIYLFLFFPEELKDKTVSAILYTLTRWKTVTPRITSLVFHALIQPSSMTKGTRLRQAEMPSSGRPASRQRCKGIPAGECLDLSRSPPEELSV